MEICTKRAYKESAPLIHRSNRRRRNLGFWEAHGGGSDKEELPLLPKVPVETEANERSMWLRVEKSKRFEERRKCIHEEAENTTH